MSAIRGVYATCGSDPSAHVRATRSSSGCHPPAAVGASDTQRADASAQRSTVGIAVLTPRLVQDLAAVEFDDLSVVR
jgi:hypothetical protein